MNQQDCWACGLEALLKARNQQLRRSLQRMNPNTQPDYEPTFELLVDVDRDLRMLRGQVRT